MSLSTPTLGVNTPSVASDAPSSTTKRVQGGSALSTLRTGLGAAALATLASASGCGALIAQMAPPPCGNDTYVGSKKSMGANGAGCSISYECRPLIGENYTTPTRACNDSESPDKL